MVDKMFPTCTGEFLDCKKTHYGIQIEIEDFAKKADRDKLYDLIKMVIESNLTPNFPSWVIMERVNGHLMNATESSHIRKDSHDPHGNRNEPDGKYAQPLKEGVGK